MPQFEQNVPITVEISAQELGVAFANLSDYEQCDFFEGVADIIKEWDHPPDVQWLAFTALMEKSPRYVGGLRVLTDIANCLLPDGFPEEKEEEYHEPGVPRHQPTNPENFWRIVGVDNYARETVADTLVIGFLKKDKAEKIATILNEGEENSDRYYRAVPPDYRMCRGMDDLI